MLRKISGMCQCTDQKTPLMNLLGDDPSKDGTAGK
jgi:hypothetical protein